jgi:dihydrofolate reductase
MLRLTLIVAATRSNGIGQNGRLPWRLPKELAYFAQVTSNAPDGHANAVIMGRNTWESIPERFRPLKKRVNIVISRNKDYELYARILVRSTLADKMLESRPPPRQTHQSTIIWTCILP